MPRPKHIKQYARIPSLNKNNNDVISDEDTSYNCIAFAAGDMTRKWWPIFHPDAYWPPNAPRINAITSFVAAFKTLGYEECDSGSHEAEFEKIALFARDANPTHAARQIGPNRWASKLGNWYDIEHTEDAVSSGTYGQIVKYMKRPKGT